MNSTLIKTTRRVIQFTIAALILLLNSAVFTQTAYAQKVAVTDLRVEHQENPLSVDADAPRMSWKITSGLKNTVQTSYELRIGTNKNELLKGRNIFWKDTKNSDQSVLVTYAGPSLTSKTRYYWQVRIKDNHGNRSPWSTVQHWQTGMKPGDWTAKWISVQGKDTSAKSPLFRKEFNLRKQVK